MSSFIFNISSVSPICIVRWIGFFWKKYEYFYWNDFDFLQVEVFKRADQDHLKDIFLKVSASKDQSLFKCYMYILFIASYLCIYV